MKYALTSTILNVKDKTIANEEVIKAIDTAVKNDISTGDIIEVLLTYSKNKKCTIPHIIQLEMQGIVNDTMYFALVI